jgi:hypothetical protein
MNISIRSILLALVVPLLLGGCFSALVGRNDGWGGGKASTGTRVAAGAADALTAPLQAPALLIAGVGEASRKAAIETNKERLALIRKDPEIIFREKWHLKSYDSGLSVVESALRDHSIGFTDPQLRRLYKEMGWQRVYVLGNPHCSVEFLRSVWNSLVNMGAWNYFEGNTMLELIRNPAVPIELIEETVRWYQTTGRHDTDIVRVLESRRKVAAAAVSGET